MRKIRIEDELKKAEEFFRKPYSDFSEPPIDMTGIDSLAIINPSNNSGFMWQKRKLPDETV